VKTQRLVLTSKKLLTVPFDIHSGSSPNYFDNPKWIIGKAFDNSRKYGRD